MSKLYEKYLKLKMENKEKLYLFSCGNFYIFLNEDAQEINNYVVLKITDFAKGVVKCGFPKNSLDNYLRIFNHHELPVELVEENESTIEDKMKKIKKKIENIDLNSTTPLMALEILEKLQKILKE